MFKKTRILILAVMTMTVMLLGSTAAFADVNNSATEPTITKNLTIAEGVTLGNTTVTFQVKQVDNPDGLAAPASIETYTVNGTVSSSKITDDIALGLAAKINKNLPGEYTFEVSETLPNEDTNWTTVDDTVYLVQVLVKNDKQTVTYSVTKKDDTAETPAKTDLVFANTYEATAGLTVSKAVTGDEYVDADTAYTFTITFVENGVAKVPAKVSGKIGTGAETDYTVTTDNKITVELKKGQTITFSGLPAGIKYTVVESDPTPNPLTVTYTGTDVDQYIDGKAQQKATGLSSASEAVLGNAGVNSVTFTNKYQPITPTGIIAHYLPYIAMILLAFAGLALYVVSKRRRAASY